MSPRSRSPPLSPELCGVPATRSVRDQTPGSATPHKDSRHIMRAAEMLETGIPQARRRILEELRRLQDPAREILQAPEGSPGCTRRLPQMRVSQEARRRLPLPAVPRRPRRRARAEAPRRHRRRRHRRVRGQARQGARALQPRLRSQPVERTCAARSFRSLLVPAAGSRAAGRARVGAPAVRVGVALQALLIPPFPPGRAAVRDRASRFLQLQRTG